MPSRRDSRGAEESRTFIARRLLKIKRNVTIGRTSCDSFTITKMQTSILSFDLDNSSANFVLPRRCHKVFLYMRSALL